MKRQVELIDLFSDICNGYSIVTINNICVYLKHQDIPLLSSVNARYSKAFNKAKNDGLLTTEQKLKELISNGLWSEEYEKEIKQKEMFLDSLKKSKAKQLLLSQKHIIEKQIEIETKSLNKLLYTKHDLIGSTADTIANKTRNKYLIIKSLFLDKPYSQYLFDDVEFIDDDLFEEAQSIFIESYNQFNERNVKCLALSEDFNLYFLACQESIYDFYGKACTQLTILQTQLFHYGRYFRHILEQESSKVIPFDIKSDPDKLVDWFEVKMVNKESSKNGETPGLVGATKEDLKALGIEKPANSVDFAKLAAKNGGSLNMEQIMELQGD